MVFFRATSHGGDLSNHHASKKNNKSRARAALNASRRAELLWQSRCNGFPGLNPTSWAPCRFGKAAALGAVVHPAGDSPCFPLSLALVGISSSWGWGHCNPHPPLRHSNVPPGKALLMLSVVNSSNPLFMQGLDEFKAAPLLACPPAESIPLEA